MAPETIYALRLVLYNAIRFARVATLFVREALQLNADAPAIQEEPRRYPRGAADLVPRAGVAAVLLLAAGLLIAALPQYFGELKDRCLLEECETFYNPPPGDAWLAAHDLTPASLAAAYMSIYAAFGFVFIGAGVVLFWKKPHEKMAWIGAIALGAIGATFTPVLDGLKAGSPLMAWSARLLDSLGFTTFILFVCTFPSGRFAPRWTLGYAAAVIGLRVPGILLPGTAVDLQAWPQPVFICWFCFWTVGMLAVTIYRYRKVLGPVERQQAAWVVYGIAWALTGLIVFTAWFVIGGEAVQADPLQLYAIEVGIHAAMLGIPVTLLAAMLRKRLWDINPLVNRTLVYAALTLCISTIYAVAVWYLGAMFQTGANMIVSLLATVAVAMLFAPLKELLQRSVNRLMYGKVEDPYTVLDRLGKRLAEPLAPEKALDVIAQTVREGLRLPYVRVSLMSQWDFVAAAEAGEPAGPLRSLPLVYRGEPQGLLELAMRGSGEELVPSEEQLLASLASQAGAIAHNVRVSLELKKLAADLQESRERLVLAREEEHRRLRDNLHDDLAPRLAALALTSAAAEELIASDPHEARTLLGGLRRTIRETVADIRRLVQDLRPRALDEFGLPEAIMERIRDMSIPLRHAGTLIDFELAVPEPLPHLPAGVEAAAYRIVSEALANVVKHAEAVRCIVRLYMETDGEERFVVEVSDDGKGFPMNEGYPLSSWRGVGLQSMKERAEELGGTFAIEKSKLGGTCIRAALPIRDY